MFRSKNTGARLAPANELDQLISAEERLTTMLREVDDRAAELIEAARREAADIEARATARSAQEMARLTADLAAQREAALSGLAAQTDLRDWMMDAGKVEMLADRVVAELLGSGKVPR